MRIPHVVALFTILFIAHAKCKPNELDNYPNDYDGDGGDDVLPEEVQSEAELPPSRILTRPQKRLVRLGEDVRMPCDVTNPNSVAVNWFRGKEPLYASDIPMTTDSQRILRQSDNTLVIRQFRESDVSDEYKCEVTSEPIQTVVHSVRTSRHIFVYPERVEVDQPNKTIRLSCQANWEPRPTFKWYLESRRLNSDAIPKDGSSLSIYNATLNDAGSYQCLAETQGEKDPQMSSIEFVFHHAPQVKVRYEEVHAGVGMEAELECQVHAFPKGDLVWYKDGGQVSGPGTNTAAPISTVETKYTRVLSDTKVSDFGLYTCRASNHLGSAAGSIVFTGAPSEPKFEGGSTHADGVTPVLQWVVTSYFPITNYTLKYRQAGRKTWQTEHPAVSDDGMVNTFRVKYPLKGLQPGNYTTKLIAQNKYGSSESKEYEISGELVTAKPDTGSGSGVGRSAVIWRSLLLAASLLVYATHL